MKKESIVVLQISLHDNDAIEIRMGGGDKVNSLMLLGILEQVQLGILADITLPVQETLDKNQQYDA